MNGSAFDLSFAFVAASISGFWILEFGSTKGDGWWRSVRRRVGSGASYYVESVVNLAVFSQLHVGIRT
jgi:hypothetical protein